MTLIIGNVLLGLVLWFFAFLILEKIMKNFRKSSFSTKDIAIKVFQVIAFLFVGILGEVLIAGSLVEIFS